MGLKNSYDFEYLVNEAERLVFEELEQQLHDDTDICKCQDCVLDMAAYALNHTAPNYRVSLLGKVSLRGEKRWLRRRCSSSKTT